MRASITNQPTLCDAGIDVDSCYTTIYVENLVVGRLSSLLEPSECLALYHEHMIVKHAAEYPQLASKVQPVPSYECRVEIDRYFAEVSFLIELSTKELVVTSVKGSSRGESCERWAKANAAKIALERIYAEQYHIEHSALPSGDMPRVMSPEEDAYKTLNVENLISGRLSVLLEAPECLALYHRHIGLKHAHEYPQLLHNAPRVPSYTFCVEIAQHFAEVSFLIELSTKQLVVTSVKSSSRGESCERWAKANAAKMALERIYSETCQSGRPQLHAK